MERDVDGRGSVAGAAQSGMLDGPVFDTYCGRLDPYTGIAPIIEISDEDYRSFCWPCYALDETGDCKPG